MKSKQFLVLGLGRFGASLAKTLCDLGQEVLAVDASTGGFNLQIAWATGYLAGLSAAESEEMT